MNARQLAHIWAQRTKKSGSASNFYFENNTIFSYGPHFPIARFVDHNGHTCVLFTTRGYSSSTSRHIGCARGAIPSSMSVFHVHNPTELDHSANWTNYLNRLQAIAKEASNPRKKQEQLLARFRDVAIEANAYATFFGLRKALPVGNDIGALVTKCQEQAARIEASEKRRKARERAAQAKQSAERLNRWLAGDDVGFPYTEETRLRIRGDIVQTSRGAEFPLDHAKRVFKLVAQCRKSKGRYDRNGHTIHLGHFALDAIDSEGNVTAGCHLVAWNEIERVAAQIGLTVDSPEEKTA